MRTVLPQGSIRWRPVLLIAILMTIAAASCGEGNESGGEPEDAAKLAVALDAEQPRRGSTLRVAVVKGHSTFDPPVVLTIPDILFTQ